MAEPRQRARPKGQLTFDDKDLSALLSAFGDDFDPLPETIKVLDEVVTDYIIETCHAAAQSASYSHRQKIKVDDFKFVLRRDPVKLGRMVDRLQTQKEIVAMRKQADVNEGNVVKAHKDADAAPGPGRGKKRKAETKE